MTAFDIGVPLTPIFYYWFGIFPISWIILSVLFRSLNWWPNNTRKGSLGADVMAYQIAASYGLLYMSTVGVIAWFKFNPEWDMSPLENDHYQGKAQFVVDNLMLPMFAYQFWNLVASLIFSEFRELAMIGHHGVTCVLAYICMNSCLHYYACFYFGFAEITNLPLHVVDTFKQFPHLRKHYSAIDEACKAIFAIGFFIIRIFYWTYMTYDMMTTLFPLLLAGRVHSTAAVGFFLFAAVFLTGLQWLWGYKIYNLVMGTGSNSQKSSKKSME